MTGLEKPRGIWRDPVIAGAASAVLWLVVHFLIFDRGRTGHVPGELDILLPARVMAEGEFLNMSLGSIHGHQPGSYIEVLLLAPFLALGLDPVSLSRLVGAMVGATTVALLAAGATTLSRGKTLQPVLTGLFVGVLATACWPVLHHETSSVWGSTPEALPLIVGSHLAAVFGKSRWIFLAAGFSAGLAWLLTPLGLVAIAVAGLSCVLRQDVNRRMATSMVALAVGASVGLTALIPSGGKGIGYFLLFNIKTKFGAAVPGPADVEKLGLAEMLVGVLAGLTPSDAPEAWPLHLMAALLPLAILATAIRSRGRDPLTVPLLLWVFVVAFVPRAADGYPAGYRYCMPPVAIGLMLAGHLAFSSLARGPRLLQLLAATPLILLVWQPYRAAPASDFVWVTAGMHRTQPRPNVGAGKSETFAPYESLRPAIPRERRVEFAFGFGLEYGSTLQTVTPPPDLNEWRPMSFRLVIENQEWTSFLNGVGCGVAVAGGWRAETAEVFDRIDRSDWAAIGAGHSACGGSLGVLPLPLGLSIGEPTVSRAEIDFAQAQPLPRMKD